MIWIPIPKAWPFCVTCKKPVERFVDLRFQPGEDEVSAMVECHGERTTLVWGKGDVRRVHFLEGAAVFDPKPRTDGLRRKIEL